MIGIVCCSHRSALHWNLDVSDCVNDGSFLIAIFFFAFSLSSWEKNYDPVPVLSWMSERPWIPIVACMLYGAAIVAGQAYFRSHDRWHWRTTLALWNAGLSLFSFVGLVRTLPQLVHNLMSYTLTENLCWDPQMTYGSGSTGLWVQLFILSKFPYVLLS